jgi:hypothetical protein
MSRLLTQLLHHFSFYTFYYSVGPRPRSNKGGRGFWSVVHPRMSHHFFGWPPTILRPCCQPFATNIGGDLYRVSETWIDEPGSNRRSDDHGGFPDMSRHFLDIRQRRVQERIPGKLIFNNLKFEFCMILVLEWYLMLA